MITHEELLREHYIVFLVGDQRFINRMGSLYALHLQAFVDAQLTGDVGATEYILDEFTNAPLQALIDAMTVVRAFGGRFRFIAQSRSEIVRKFGQQQMLTISENAVVKQWFGFSSFEEAKLVSDAMGQRDVINPSINMSDDNLSASFGRGKEPLMSPEELMALPRDQQIIHIKDVGFIRARKLYQNEIAPYAYDLADNPLEGGRLDPDIKVKLPTKHYGAGKGA